MKHNLLMLCICLCGLAAQAQTYVEMDQAERGRNFSICKSGLSDMCNRELLTEEQTLVVEAYESKRNYENCKNGLACNKGLLSFAQQRELERDGIGYNGIIDDGPSRGTQPSQSANTTATAGARSSSMPGSNTRSISSTIPKTPNLKLRNYQSTSSSRKPEGDRR